MSTAENFTEVTTESTKTCNKCNLNLPVSHFEKYKNSCKSCKVKYNRERVAEKRKLVEMCGDDNKKRCVTCERELFAKTDFEVGRHECKHCRQTKKYKHGVEQKASGDEPYYPENCVQCGVIFTKSTFTMRCDRNAYHSICNTCKTKRGNEGSQRYREKKKGDVAFLKRTAETHRAYVSEHAEQIREQVKTNYTNPTFKLSVYRTSAKQKKLHFEESDNDWFMARFVTPCYYCGITVDEHENNMLNGLDRVNNEFGYIRGNVVACCTLCNYMRGPKLSVEEFINLARKVANYCTAEEENCPCYPYSLHPARFCTISASLANQSERKWKAIVKRAQRFDTSDIREDDCDWFKMVMILECYYCGVNPMQSGTVNGLDRIDNTMGYKRGNVLPCCTNCNMARGEYSVLEFVTKMRRIHHRHLDTTTYPTYAVNTNQEVSIPESRPRLIHAPSLQGSRVCFYDGNTGAVGQIENTIKDAANVANISRASAYNYINDPTAVWIRPNWKVRRILPGENVEISEDAAAAFQIDVIAKHRR